jgi:hypothetical protein
MPVAYAVDGRFQKISAELAAKGPVTWAPLAWGGSKQKMSQFSLKSGLVTWCVDFLLLMIVAIAGLDSLTKAEATTARYANEYFHRRWIT